MLSDESSSDSETGRFKCKSTNQEQKKSSNQREDNTRFSGRSRPADESRSRRDLDRQKDERERFSRHNRDRHRHSRYSPVSRRRQNSRDRGTRRSHDRFKNRGDSRGRSKPADYRSSSRDRHKSSGSYLQKPPEHSRDLKAEIRRNLCPKDERKGRPIEKSERKSLEKILSSPEPRPKKSEIHRPSPVQSRKRKSESPILVEHSDESDDVKPGSYYNMIPAIIKEKSDESSEIDSSDDEKLRAKLLNLEKELHKTRKKKHKKKHKRKSSKSSKDREHDPVTLVEVSSTTDIQESTEIDKQNLISEPIEVSSTQKSNLKESESESGEISSDENSENDFEIDATDLRHKLKRSGAKQKYAKDVCGPALPPHLKNRYAGSSSDIEGPALPPHLKSRSKNIGPSIPDDMRKILAETDHEKIKHDSSDEDVGIGPLPTGAEGKWSEAHKRLEERALNMKLKQLEGQSYHSEKVKSREQWMLELPESKAKFLGLEARTFRAKEGPDMSDRSSWTDTPEQKAHKAAGLVKEEDADVALQREAKARQISIRDEEQESAVKKHKKKHKREESLLEMHQKKLKKKKKKEEKDDGKKERRPFSRDVDLQVNRFDEAQKKSIIKKAQDLNTRFSQGQAKFL